MRLKKRLTTLLAGLALVFGVFATAPTSPAQAAIVPNMYECHPSTGWCYQTNPPYNAAYPRACRWNYRIGWLTSGMWYTGCTAGYWRPEVH